MSLPVIRHPAALDTGSYVYDPFDMEALRQPDMTEEDYLATEPYSEIKREFLGGAVYAMAGADESHNLIAFDLYGMLYNRLRGRSSKGFGHDMQVRIIASDPNLPPCHY